MENTKVCTRQICLFCAFILPLYKLVEVPSLLARYAKDDLLFPALAHFLVQAGAVWLLLFLLSSKKRPLFDRVSGAGAKILFGTLSVVYLLLAVIPLLDLEKFTYAIFYDTSPTLFSFAFFFIFSAYLCMRPPQIVGRIADLSPFLSLAPFLLLIVMSLAEADFSNLLPVFNYGFGHTVSAFKHTLPHFSDALLLLPLLGNFEYKKGDTKKIVGAYTVGAFLTLVFLAVFFCLFSSIAPKEHYAFAKIAQYLPALAVVGRVDLVFVYILCVPLFFCTALPLFYSVQTANKVFANRARLPLVVGVNFGAFLFTLLCNRFYDKIYALFGNTLFFLFPLALVPAFLLFLFGRKKS